MSQSTKRSRASTSTSSPSAHVNIRDTTSSRKIRRVAKDVKDLEYNCYSGLDYRSVPYCLPASQEVKGKELKGRYPNLKTCQEKCQAVIPKQVGTNILSFLNPKELKEAKIAGAKKGVERIEEFEEDKDAILEEYQFYSDESKQEYLDRICNLVKRSYGLPYAYEINRMIIPYTNSAKELNCMLDNPNWPIGSDDYVLTEAKSLLQNADKLSLQVFEKMSKRGLFEFKHPTKIDALAIYTLISDAGQRLSPEVIGRLLKHQVSLKKLPSIRGKFLTRLVMELFKDATPHRLFDDDDNKVDDDEDRFTRADYNMAVDKTLKKLLLISQLLDDDILGPIYFDYHVVWAYDGPRYFPQFAKAILQRLETIPNVSQQTKQNIKTLIYWANRNLKHSDFRQGFEELKNELSDVATQYENDHPFKGDDINSVDPKDIGYYQGYDWSLWGEFRY